MRLIWDEAKRASNLTKHRVDFAAAESFEWATAIALPDQRRSYGEDRILAFGLIGDRLHSLVYTRRDDAVRVISLRKANARERKRYEEAKKSVP
jgi:uncharacterized protein